MADVWFDHPAMRQEMQAVPRPVEGELGLVEVDTSCGTIQPMEVAQDVRTVGEVELIEHLQASPYWFARTSPGCCTGE